MQIINLGNRITNQYLIELQSGYLLIDTGYSNGFERFMSSLRKNHIQPEKIIYIFITHVHDDHVGFLGKLLSILPNATLITNSSAKQRLLEGHNRFVGGATTKQAFLFCKLMAIIGKGKHEFPIVDIDRYKIINVDKSEILRPYGINANIIFLPGHTDDQMGLLFDNGILFCGDAAMNGFPSKHKIIIFVEDLQKYKKTWDSIIGNKKIETIYPAHGKPFGVIHINKNRRKLEKINLRKI